MTFKLEKRDPVIDFGDYAGVPTKEWPLWYLHRMYSLAKDGRIMDKELASSIINTYERGNR